MSEFEIVLGPMRAGKTTYCENSGKAFISHDGLMARFQQKFDLLFDEVVRTLNASPDRDFTIDGWFSVYNSDPATVTRLAKSVRQRVRIVCFYAPVDILLERIKTSTSKHTREDILGVYSRMIKFYVDELRGFDFAFRDSDREYAFTEFMGKVRGDMVTATPGDVDGFVEYLKNAPHYDKYYQTIPLPHGRTIRGYERTELTWDIVRQRVDFRGRTVLDAGCFHAYASFGAEDAGALRVVGVDRVAQALETARRLRDIWHYKTEFVLADLDEWTPDGRYDVVMCLNTVQHLKKPADVVARLFGAGDTVVWEADEKYRSMFEGQKTHRLVKEEESPRWRDLKRKIYYYRRI